MIALLLASLAPPAVGAIYDPATFAALTDGTRAARVGDVVTVRLVERTRAAKQAQLGTGRDGSFGLKLPATGPFSLLDESDTSFGGRSGFKGQGQASAGHELSGEISAVVTGVRPGGLLEIEGVRTLTLHRGEETLRLTGLVRVADIGADNRVPSSRVANADIRFTGRGEVARSARMGWLQRFFDKVSPF